MTKTAAGITATALGLGAAIGVWLWSTADDRRDRRVPAEFERAGQAHRCARLAPLPDKTAAPTTAVAGMTATLSGRSVRITPASAGPVTVGVVTDARANTEHLRTIRSAFADRGVSLVVSLGGMGRTRAELETALSTLTGPWYLLAVPGDWESLPVHRQVSADLVPAGVIDGVTVRTLQIGAITLGTWPGVPNTRQAMAGADGCTFTATDTDDLPALFAQAQGPRVLVTHTPPRQTGPEATDDTRAGVNIGDRALARAVEDAQVAVVIHGLLATAPSEPTRPMTLANATPIVLSAGAADGIADLTTHGKWRPLALMITIDGDSVSWQYLRK